MAKLPAVGVPFLRGAPNLEFLGLPIKLRDGILVHHAHPGTIVLVEFKIERAFRPSRLDDRDGILRHLTGLPIHLSEEHLTEIGVRDAGSALEHHVLRLNQWTRPLASA